LPYAQICGVRDDLYSSVLRNVEIALAPFDIHNDAIVRAAALEAANVQDANDVHVRLVRRSLDARARTPLYRIKAEVHVGEPPPIRTVHKDQLRDADPNKRVVVVGAGPAGYFAALELLRCGIKPIVVERGKDVRARRRDLRALQQESIVNPHSNYCFGEGGAGTYSDGKLYTRSTKRGNIETVLELLVEHGAHPDILLDAHPHIGSNKLWLVVQEIRHTIERFGGEVLFDAHVVDLVLHEKNIHGVVLADGREVLGSAVIMATGHSARDVYELCARRNVAIEAKPFALGVRIEHPQPLIDSIQYFTPTQLPAASYSLACQVDGRGVFSFCMCPGGLIVPSATSPGEIVVNGMSMSRRDSPFANAGTVVAIEQPDWQHLEHEHAALAAMKFQSDVEQRAFALTQTQRAPAQRLTDFIRGAVSQSLPDTSYIPGVQSADLRGILPTSIHKRLLAAIGEFGKKMPGYITSEALMVGVESRTSSPVRIPRDSETLEHIEVKGLFPCGEGAGYAGGIVSAAIDGQNVAQSIAARIFSAA